MKELIYKLYKKLYYNNQQNNWLDYFISKKFGSKPLYFVQVGANDGKTGDPIYKYIVDNKWKGLLIEPHPYFFKALKETYKGHSNLEFVEAAIVSDPVDSISLFVASEDLSDWRSLVSSTDASRGEIKWLKNQGEIKEIKVKATTFSQLLQQYNVTGIDLLQIDVEGLENVILSAYPFNKLKPALIHFEHKHLTYAEMADLEKKLTAQGYRLYTEKYDTLCCLEG